MRILDQGKKLKCDGPCDWEPLDINGGTLVDGTTYTFNTPSTLIDLGQGTIEHGNSEELIVTFSDPVDLRFTSAVANTSRTSWHCNGTGSICSSANTNGGGWCYNPGSVPVDLIIDGQEVRTALGFTGVNGNADWGELVTYGADQVGMLSYVFDAYNYEARPRTIRCEQDVCDVTDDIQNRLKILEQSGDSVDPGTETLTSVSQDLTDDTITYTDEDGLDTVLDLSKYCYTMFSFEYEENGTLSSNTLEWSVGNGSVGAVNLVVPVDAEIVHATFSSEIGGTSVSIGIRVDDVVQQTPLFTGQHGATTLATPISVTAGQRVGVITGIETGAYTDARVSLFFRTKVTI